MARGFPDWYLPVALQGWDGTQHRPILVLDTGELYAQLKCVYNAAKINVKGDVDGNLTLNIKAQDLAEVINRPKYGSARTVEGGKIVTASSTTILASVAGKGMIYGGCCFLAYSSSQRFSRPLLKVDGQSLAYYNFYTLDELKINQDHTCPIYLLLYDDTNFKYSTGISTEITFEESFELAYIEEYGATPLVYYNVYYALI